MLAHSPQKDESSEEEDVVVSRRLSRRWKLLLALGATLIVLAGLIDRSSVSERSEPAPPLFLLMLGIIVFIAGFVVRRRGVGRLDSR
jgi:hypothetical protein